MTMFVRKFVVPFIPSKAIVSVKETLCPWYSNFGLIIKSYNEYD